LGGAHNFAVDRVLAEQFLAIEPDAGLNARSNRDFLYRAVRFLAISGIRQFIDLGSGIPTEGNVHEIARKVTAEARVVYVDIDDVAVTISRNILAGDPFAAVIQADLRDAGGVMTDPELRALIDVEQPVAILAVAVLHFLLDADDPDSVMSRYRATVASGSYLAISHITDDHRPEQITAIRRLGERAGTPSTPRSRAQIEALFGDDWDLVPPGVTWTAAWRPDHGKSRILDDAPARSNFLAGIARKPHHEPTPRETDPS
jgi:hypothetical protein